MNQKSKAQNLNCNKGKGKIEKGEKEEELAVDLAGSPSSENS